MVAKRTIHKINDDVYVEQIGDQRYEYRREFEFVSVRFLDIRVVYSATVDLKEFQDRKSTRLNSSHVSESRMPSSA